MIFVAAGTQDGRELRGVRREGGWQVRGGDGGD